MVERGRKSTEKDRKTYRESNIEAVKWAGTQDGSIAGEFLSVIGTYGFWPPRKCFHMQIRW